jgi:hypothetical protein
MPEFILDTDGSVTRHDGAALHFYDDLDSFTRGYVEALFFTEEEPRLSSASSSRPQSKRSQRSGAYQASSIGH